jgi:hypothetical protein
MLKRGEKAMKKFGLLGLICVILAGCVTAVPPARYDIETTGAFFKPYDRVWEEVVFFFAETNTNIRTIDKASGVVSSETVRVEALVRNEKVLSEWCDCGTPATGWYVDGPLARYNIFVRKLSEAETSVQVNMAFFTILASRFAPEVNPCASKGLAERRFLDRLARRLYGPPGGGADKGGVKGGGAPLRN